MREAKRGENGVEQGSWVEKRERRVNKDEGETVTEWKKTGREKESDRKNNSNQDKILKVARPILKFYQEEDGARIQRQ